MSIVKWDPFKNVATLQDRINKLFDDSFPRTSDDDSDLEVCAWRPTVDIYETSDGIIIKADLPGVLKENLFVEVKDNILTLKGERKDEQTVDENRYFRKERSCGNFLRAFTLQYTVEPEKVTAKFKDGVLKIYVPKPEVETPKRVTVDID